MSNGETARAVRSVYLADPGARDALRARWPALALALDRLVAEDNGLMPADALSRMSHRWRRGPWGTPLERMETIE